MSLVLPLPFERGRLSADELPTSMVSQLDDAMRLWDGIFAEDSTLRLVEFICLAMLLRIRNSSEFPFPPSFVRPSSRFVLDNR